MAKKKKEAVIEEIKPIGYYVEVLYFKDGIFTGRKWADYSEVEAKQMYQRTINKFQELKEQAIISIRDSNHILQISERLNLEYEAVSGSGTSQGSKKIKSNPKKKAAKIFDTIE